MNKSERDITLSREYNLYNLDYHVKTIGFTCFVRYFSDNVIHFRFDETEKKNHLQ